MKETPLPFTVSAMIDLRAIGDAVERAQRPLDRGDVVAVAPADVPAEGAKLGFEVAQIAHLLRPRCPTESCCDRSIATISPSW